MKRLLNIIWIILIGSSIWAQTIIKGRVTDEKDISVPGANVYILGTYEGASSGPDGSFYFETDLNGRQTLIISFIGYANFQREIETGKGEINVEIKLKEEVDRLDAVVITAGSFKATGEHNSEAMRPMDIVTTAGATADIAGVLNTLPGTNVVGEEGRLFVRGGGHEESKVFIDGIFVPNPYSQAVPSSPTRVRFLPFMFKGMSFSTGAYSAEFGNANSSVLALDSKDKATANRGDISILSLGAEASLTRAWDKGSFAGKGGYHNLSPYFMLARHPYEWRMGPMDIEMSAVIRQEYGKNGIWKMFTHANRAKMKMDLDDFQTRTVVPVSIYNDYFYLNSVAENYVGEKWGYFTGTGVGWQAVTKGDGAASTEDHNLQSHWKSMLFFDPTSSWHITSGVELYTLNIRSSSEGQQAYKWPDIEEQSLATFIDATHYLNKNFVIRGGLRGTAKLGTKRAYLEPRLSLALKTGNNSQLSVGYGKFSQEVNAKYKRSLEDIIRERAVHYILGYQFSSDNRTLRGELYYKGYTQLVRVINSLPISEGHGYAGGLDVFFRDAKSIRNVDYWVSYSYIDSKRLYADFPVSVTPSYISDHTFSLVTKVFFQKIRSQAGGAFIIAGGRPYHNPSRPGFMQEKTPIYKDLSINWSYLFRPNVIIHASVSNVFGFKNIYGYEYRHAPGTDTGYEAQPVELPLRRFGFAGVFITLSKNKGLNQLPNL